MVTLTIVDSSSSTATATTTTTTSSSSTCCNNSRTRHHHHRRSSRLRRRRRRHSINSNSTILLLHHHGSTSSPSLIFIVHKLQQFIRVLLLLLVVGIILLLSCISLQCFECITTVMSFTTTISTCTRAFTRRYTYNNNNHFLLSLSSSPDDVDTTTVSTKTTPLSMPIDQLSTHLNGKGRAIITWDCYKIGLDPLYFFHHHHHDNFFQDEKIKVEPKRTSSTLWDHTVYNTIQHLVKNKIKSNNNNNNNNNNYNKQINNHEHINTNHRTKLIQQYMPMKRHDIYTKKQGLSDAVLHTLSTLYTNSLGIEYSIASLVNVQQSNDGTMKMLLKLNNKSRHDDDDDNNNNNHVHNEKEYYIESVIIPWYDRSNPSSTLCVSTQVGCAQGCTFCATGRMGLMKRLTSDEILIQLYFANKICRVLNDIMNIDCDYDVVVDNNNKKKNQCFLPPIDNIVFMGMGDSGDNADAVIKACSIMADRQCFAIPQNKITISTVAPNPEIFSILSKADAVLAWSVHAVNDTLRKKLVPTTKYTMEELREGLIHALMNRSKRMRAVMIEVTLIEYVNDGIEEAKDMVQFCLELKERVPGMKLVVNLIPFNDISHVSYRRSPKENVAAYQQVLVENGVMTYVRTTRGDDENAACGQLATKKLKQR